MINITQPLHLGLRMKCNIAKYKVLKLNGVKNPGNNDIINANGIRTIALVSVVNLV